MSTKGKYVVGAWTWAILVGGASVVGCAAADGGPEGAAAQEAPVVEGISSMQKRPDGRFEVTCDNGRVEIVTADQLRRNDVCQGVGDGGGGGGSDSAIGRFACDSSANLAISVIGPSGTEKHASVPIGVFSRCNQIAADLSGKRRDIARALLVGVCDSSANLERFAMTPRGDLQVLSTVEVGVFSRCDDQAGKVNDAVATSSGDAAMASFVCDSSANLEIGVVGAAGTEKRATVEIGVFSRCDAIAATLDANRRDIRRLSLIGVCDSSANLEQFSLTARGELTPTSTLQIGVFSSCDAQAADVDR